MLPFQSKEKIYTIVKWVKKQDDTKKSTGYFLKGNKISNWVCKQKSVHENYFSVYAIIINCNKPYTEKENSNIQMFQSKTMLDLESKILN